MHIAEAVVLEDVPDNIAGGLGILVVGLAGIVVVVGRLVVAGMLGEFDAGHPGLVYHEHQPGDKFYITF